MCANNLDPQIATYIGTVKSQSFDTLVSKASNVKRQYAGQKGAQSKREKGKSLTKKGELTAIFIKTNTNLSNSGHTYKNGERKQKEKG